MRLRRCGSWVAGALAMSALAACAAPAPALAPTPSPGTDSPARPAAAPSATAPSRTPSATASLQPGEPLLASRWKPDGPDLVAWTDPTAVSHLFYHSLIVDPKRAFASRQAKGYRAYMVTVGEFKAELNQLYAKGYILVHPERLAAPDADGVMRDTPLLLPKGRKPLVISVDDVNYYDYMTGDGFASNLFFTAEGRLANHYTDAAGAAQVGSFDVAPIVDDFVRDHPDFSYDGDKGTLAETGYNGVLGYRSSKRAYGDTPATQEAAARATDVATEIKKDGWNFASHSWGHLNFKTETLGTLKLDTASWDAEVRPIVGPTQEFIFPFGADIAGVEPYSPSNPKYAFLHQTEGYCYFFPIDATRPAWGQLAAGGLRQARVNVDGTSLDRAAAHPNDVLWTFFDPTVDRDPNR